MMNACWKRIGACVGLVGAAFAGCATPAPDARLAAIEEELCTLREEVARFRRASELPVEGMPDVVVDPVDFARFRNRQALTIGKDVRQLRNDADALKKDVEELKKEIEAMKKE
jgi:hypothetical protein